MDSLSYLIDVYEIRLHDHPHHQFHSIFDTLFQNWNYRSSVWLICNIQNHWTLTTACTVSVTKVTDAIARRNAGSRIITFGTSSATTVHICFILVFNTVNTCFRCWNQKTFTVSNLLLIFYTYGRIYCFCKYYWDSRKHSYTLEYCYTSDIWHHHSRYQFHLDFWFCQCMFQELKLRRV